MVHGAGAAGAASAVCHMPIVLCVTRRVVRSGTREWAPHDTGGNSHAYCGE